MFNSSLTDPTQNFRFFAADCGLRGSSPSPPPPAPLGELQGPTRPTEGIKISPPHPRSVLAKKTCAGRRPGRRPGQKTLTSFLQRSISSALSSSPLSALLSLSLRMRRSRPKEETDSARISDLYPRLMILSGGWNVD